MKFQTKTALLSLAILIASMTFIDAARKHPRSDASINQVDVCAEMLSFPALFDEEDEVYEDLIDNLLVRHDTRPAKRATLRPSTPPATPSAEVVFTDAELTFLTDVLENAEETPAGLSLPLPAPALQTAPPCDTPSSVSLRSSPGTDTSEISTTDLFIAAVVSTSLDQRGVAQAKKILANQPKVTTPCTNPDCPAHGDCVVQ
ncbi:hypothetical protein FJ365_02000 [Candidatus Dependentiae bacterium]|nr:hypothetical protein [Candidatus Dependentiae bacterium]